MSPAPPVLAKAPGKIILSGEHAVVYGKPALATAVRRFATARIRPDEQAWLRVVSPFGETGIADEAEGQSLCDRVLDRHALFEDGALPIAEVLADPQAFIQMGWLLLFRAFPDRVSPGCRLEIETDLPLGAGMGSSAAVAAAVVAATADRAGLRLGPDDVAAFADRVERLQHGRPSGVDVRLAVQGGSIWFQRDEPPSPVDLSSGRYCLAHTGPPAAGTGECVAAVRDRWGDDPELWNSFEAVTRQVREALTTDNPPGLIDAVRENHRLLSRIGVVPNPVRRWIAALEETGGAAKVCGAGAVRGEHGGMVWVVGDAAQAIAEEGPYPVCYTEGEPNGVRILD